MKYYREITGSIIVSILLIATISTCIVCGAASENTSDSDKGYYDLAGLMLIPPNEANKEDMLQWIDETELISDDEKTGLKQDLLDAWERYPDNTEEDLETAKIALDISVDVAAKEKAANPTSTASTSSSKTYNTQDETVGERPPVEEVEEEEVVEEMSEEETTQSATPGFSALGLVFVISLILIRRNR